MWKAIQELYFWVLRHIQGFKKTPKQLIKHWDLTVPSYWSPPRPRIAGYYLEAEEWLSSLFTKDMELAEE